MEEGERIRRDHPKLIRFSAPELEQVAASAAAAGRPVACYIRDCALGSRPRARTRLASEQLIRDLGRLGTRLSTAARAATALGAPQANELQSALDDLLKTIKDLQ
jgi:hypothetical protein